MADNIAITQGTGTTVAADDISSVYYQKVKLVDGTADATAAIAADIGVKANALRVAPASDITDATYIGDIKFGEALPAGTANIGDVDVASIAAGTNAIGKLLAPNIDVTTNSVYTKKYYTNAGAVTDGIIWSPAAATRWHVTSLYINVSAAATITLEDDLAGGDSPIWKGEFAANSGAVINFGSEYPLCSGEDAADLIITTTAGNVYVTAVGYEI